MGSSRPPRENKGIDLGPFEAPGSGFMALKGDKAYNTNMSQVVIKLSYGHFSKKLFKVEARSKLICIKFYSFPLLP